MTWELCHVNGDWSIQNTDTKELIQIANGSLHKPNREGILKVIDLLNEKRGGVK